MQARIYSPSKTAMQSGKAGTAMWILEFASAERKQVDPLMGWTSSGDMLGQVRLTFSTKDEAIAYAKARGMAYVVDSESPRRATKPKSYASNFAYTRREPWSH